MSPTGHESESITEVGRKPIFKVTAELQRIQELVDHSVKFSLVSLQELSDADYLWLRHRQGETGTMLWSPADLDEDDLSEADTAGGDLLESKKPSLRLRATLYVLWTKRNPTAAQRTLLPFSAFYRQTMEAFIDRTKEKITAIEDGT